MHNPINSELTLMQAKMFICNQMPIYRLPLLYGLEAGDTYESVRSALYLTFQDHLLLQVKYGYNPDHRKFYQQIMPIPQEDFTISIQLIDEDPIAYVSRRRSGIDLNRDYPWYIQFIEYQDKRFLYIEFHHICIDGLGIRSFEATFMNRLKHNPSTPLPGTLNLSTYRKICELQRSVDDTKHSSFNNLVLPQTTTMIHKNARLNRWTKDLQPHQQNTIAAMARTMNVTKSAIYQGVMEEVLMNSCDGEAYGTIGNWRIHLGNFNEVGCFARMQPQLLNRNLSLEDRVKHIFSGNLKRFMNQDQEMRGSLDFSIVFSYEEDMFQHFRYIPVDQLCKFDLYIRVHSYHKHTQVEFEYNRSKYSEDQMIAIYEEFVSILDQYAE
ncbi:condensation domain-containing protein [Paenibacillus sp. KN14-4R]|uniref:condensation domain-containing protein n=1 Tax=Paenibacillus sp. KN14-4R TaxID=3445773 RepID=UPI003FA05FF9